MKFFKNGYVPHYIKIIRQHYIKQNIDTAITYLKANYWGVKLEKGGTFVGLPKFRKTPMSHLSIGKNVRMLSSFTSNLHGLNRKCMISTLSKEANLVIGDDVGLSGVVIASSIGVKIGDRVMIGANSTITDTDSHAIKYKYRHPEYYNLKTNDFQEPILTKEVIIENDVFIGMNTLVLKGSFIGAGSVIGAGSIVSGYIPPNVIAVGQPAKVVKNLI